MEKSNLYDEDFFCWTLENAALLRAGKFGEADLQHIAEEIEDMGKRDRAGVQSRMLIILAHLLKWQAQPDRRSPSWRRTITRERVKIPLVFKHSPSLRNYAREDLADAYAGAVKLASQETGIPKSQFPAACPYSFEQVLDDEFFPEAEN